MINSEYIELQRELAEIRERIKQTQLSLDRSNDPALKADLTVRLSMFRRLEYNTVNRMQSYVLSGRIDECRKRIDNSKKLIDLMAADRTPSARLLRSLEGSRRSLRRDSEELRDLEQRKVEADAEISRFQETERPEWQKVNKKTRERETLRRRRPEPKFDVPDAQVKAAPSKETVGRYRVDKILQAEKEIGILRPLINSLADYDRVKSEHPDYITIKAAERDPALKELLLGIQGHTQKKALRFAKQIAAAECNVTLNTIETAWDRYKPDSRRSSKKRKLKNAPPGPRASRKSPGKK